MHGLLQLQLLPISLVKVLSRQGKMEPTTTTATAAEVEVEVEPSTPTTALPIAPTTTAKSKTSLEKLLSKIDTNYDTPAATPSTRRSWIATACVSFIFLQWGIAYGLLDNMNAKVRAVMAIPSSLSSLQASFYYIPYTFIPYLTARYIIGKGGYKYAFLGGFALIFSGCFVLALGAWLSTFAVFLVGFIVTGCGVAMLERSANPYAVMCGDKRFAEIRINVCQGSAALGTVIAPVLCSKFLFDTSEVIGKHLTEEQKAASMGRITNLYLYVGIFVVVETLVLAFVLFRTSWIPELPVNEHLTGQTAGSDEVQQSIGWKESVKHPLATVRKVSSHPIFKVKILWFAIACNFLNMGNQVTVAQFFQQYCQENAGLTLSMGAFWMMIAQVLFMIGRFVAAGACCGLKGRKVLLIWMVGACAFMSAATRVAGFSGVVMMLMVMFFESTLFPTVFATASKGLGELESTGETLMIMSISGGALQPPLFGFLSDHLTKVGVAQPVQKAYILTATLFGLMIIYGLLVNLVPSMRKRADAEATAEVSNNDTEMQPVPIARSASKKESGVAAQEIKNSISTQGSTSVVHET